MSKKRINHSEVATAIESIHYLADIFLAIGITELRISKKDHIIYWDTDKGGGIIDPDKLSHFHDMIEDYFFHQATIQEEIHNE